MERIAKGHATHRSIERVFKVFTGNGDEEEEYPRIHESADRGAAAAAGWEGSSVHHAARRIASLDTWEDNAPMPPALC